MTTKVTHEDLRAGRLNVYKLTGSEAKDLVTAYDAVVAERDKLRFDLSMFMHPPSLPDDDEPITAEWWREESPATSIDCAYICFTNGVRLSLFNGKQATIQLPAVRTRGDVRTLVRLLGRE